MWMSAALVLLVAVSASWAITCPDGKTCSDDSTCCSTSGGYACCPYPNGVCCADRAHCCPAGFSCNSVTQMCEREDGPRAQVPLLRRAGAPSPPVFPVSSLAEVSESDGPPGQSRGLAKATVIYCDSYTYCDDDTTCCRDPNGNWYCCSVADGWCCSDGYHCCPYGYDCDSTFTKCIRQGLRYPPPQKQASLSIPATHIRASPKQVPLTALRPATHLKPPRSGVIRCDSTFHCQSGHSCCKMPSGTWSCCPFPLGQCSSDGEHCCEYGYTCDAGSPTRTPSLSGLEGDAKQDRALF